MRQESKPPARTEANYGTTLTYVSGFVLSLALTLCAYLLVRKHVANHHISPTDMFMVIALSILALTQLITQLVFFFHLDSKSTPRWNFVVLGFALIVIVIIAAGSLWIMYHLNYNMTPQQMTQYMQQQNGGL